MNKLSYKDIHKLYQVLQEKSHIDTILQLKLQTESSRELKTKRDKEERA